MTTGGEVYSTGFGGSFFNGAGGLGHGNRSQLDEPKRIPTFGRGSGLVAAVSVSAGALLRSSLRIHMDESSAGHAKKKECLLPAAPPLRIPAVPRPARWLPLDGRGRGARRLVLGPRRVGTPR